MIPKISVGLDFISKSDDEDQSKEISKLFTGLFNATHDNTFTLKVGQGSWYFKTPYEKTYEIDKHFCLALDFLEKHKDSISLKKDLFSDIVIRFPIYACDTIPSLFFSAKELKRLHSFEFEVTIDVDIVLTAE